MIAIDELFRSGAVKPVPVYLDGMIQEATAIHSSHPNYLTQSLRKSLLTDDGNNPFTSEWFRPVQGREMRESIVMDSSPCIVLATSGMMNGGPVMNYFQNWAHENRNSFVSSVTKQKVHSEGDYKRDSVKFQWLSMGKLKS